VKFLLKPSLLAKVISIIYLPPLVSLWLFIVFALYSPAKIGNPSLFFVFVGITFFTILPLLTLILLARDHGPTFAVPRASRNLSYAVVFLEYIIGSLIFYLGKVAILFIIGLIYIVIIATLMVINRFWKISVHAAGISELYDKVHPVTRFLIRVALFKADLAIQLYEQIRTPQVFNIGRYM